MHDSSKIVVGEVNQRSQLYTFSKFIVKSKPALLPTHVNDDSRLWHVRFGHLNFRYI
jgi:hypothetical protein